MDEIKFKVELLKKYFKKKYGRHFFSQIHKVENYEQLPKIFKKETFRNDKNSLGKKIFEHHNSQGNFYSIKIDEKNILVWTGFNGDVICVDEFDTRIDNSVIMSFLNLNAFNLSAKDFFEEITSGKNTKKSEEKTSISEQKLNKIIKRVLREFY